MSILGFVHSTGGSPRLAQYECPHPGCPNITVAETAPVCPKHRRRMRKRGRS